MSAYHQLSDDDRMLFDHLQSLMALPRKTVVVFVAIHAEAENLTFNQALHALFGVAMRGAN